MFKVMKAKDKEDILKAGRGRKDTWHAEEQGPEDHTPDAETTQAGDQEEEGQMPLYTWSSDLYTGQTGLLKTRRDFRCDKAG